VGDLDVHDVHESKVLRARLALRCDAGLRSAARMLGRVRGRRRMRDGVRQAVHQRDIELQCHRELPAQLVRHGVFTLIRSRLARA
jgi:hypothetical protein